MSSSYRRGPTTAPELPPQPVSKSLKYTAAQEHLLRRLGSALVLQWDAVPDAIQDLLIDQAALVDDRDEAVHTAEEIEGFIRGAKTVSLAKAPITTS